MEKNIEQYIPLYLGQKVYENYNNRVVTLTGVNTKEESPVKVLHDKTGTVWGFKYHEIKLILRPLSSMTEDEKREFIGEPEATENYLSEMTKIKMRSFNPERVLWLLSKGFDIFGLKEKGLCLYPEEL